MCRSGKKDEWRCPLAVTLRRAAEMASPNPRVSTRTRVFDSSANLYSATPGGAVSDVYEPKVERATGRNVQMYMQKSIAPGGQKTRVPMPTRGWAAEGGGGRQPQSASEHPHSCVLSDRRTAPAYLQAQPFQSAPPPGRRPGGGGGWEMTKSNCRSHNGHTAKRVLHCTLVFLAGQCGTTGTTPTADPRTGACPGSCCRTRTRVRAMDPEVARHARAAGVEGRQR